MNDNDRALIEQVLRAAGEAGEKGFAYLVQYKLIDGVVSVIGFTIALAGVLWLLRRAFAWEPDDEDGYIPRGLAIVALSIVAFFMLCGVFTGVTTALAPEGAAIHSVLTK